MFQREKRAALDDIDMLTKLTARLPYPAGIRHVEPGAIAGPAFFPGGTGILDSDIPASASPGRYVPPGGALILGHNFHDVASWQASVSAGGEIGRTATWRNLVPMLTGFGIAPSTCFFTNAFMGLMERPGPMGTHPGHSDVGFRAACITLLRATIALQRPSIVLALGKQAPRLLAEAIPGLNGWRQRWSFKEFDSLRLHEVGLRTCLPGEARPMP